MKLDNFKELLLKKSGDDISLQVLIKYMKEDYLADHIVESLQKMAASNSKKNPNAAVKAFAGNMNNFKAGMVHDALSHHASHYKAALNAGDTKVADDHMRQIFRTMHIAEKATKDGLNDHSNGKLKIHAVDPKPWERGDYLKTTNRSGDDTGKYVTDTNGWKRHGANQNYDFLRGAPHPDSRKPGDGHYKKEVAAHGHNKAYPLEEIRVNGKHIHIDDDVEHTGEFTTHPMDSHPIYGHYHHSPSSYGADKKAQYQEERDAFHNDEQGGKAQYRAKLANISKEDYAKRGAEKSSPVHKDIEGLDTSDKKISPEDLKARLARIRGIK